MDLSKKAGETLSQYLWRLGSAKDAGLVSMSWTELASVMNKELFDDEVDYMGESAYRKRYGYAKEMYEEVFRQMDGSSDINEKLRELERQKIQFRDERNAWNKQNYTDARAAQKLDYLEEQLKEIGRVEFEAHHSPVINSDNDILIMLSDLHIGETFNSLWGTYNSEVARDRLEKLFDEVRRIRERHGSAKCYVVLSGDTISGNIHKSIQVTNRENVIDQIKIATELVASFCYELAEIFEDVYLTDVAGNHSRIDKKEDAMHDERLDDLVSWGISLILDGVDNFHTLEHRKLDSGISTMMIRGKTYVNVHGDFDSYSQAGASKLCMMLGFIPYAITTGHLHTCSVEEFGGVKMIRGGSLAGCGDQYTIEKRLCGEPSQMVCVCDECGVVCYYPVALG